MLASNASTMSVNSVASKSMLSFIMFVGIESKSHVLIVNMRTMRVISIARVP